MPGHNHYSWCMCGWCYKSGINGYGRRIVIDHEKSYAMRTLMEYGVDRSWTACFVIPNASCPVCFQKVYYYQNQSGSRVFFDELGWPWPKHACTNNVRLAKGPRASHLVAVSPFVRRTHGDISEISMQAIAAEFDPNAAFRSKHGHSPFDLFIVMKVRRLGFENLIMAESVSPPLDSPIFVAFTSATTVPMCGEYFSFDGSNVSFLNQEVFASQAYKAREITSEKFGSKIM